MSIKDTHKFDSVLFCKHFSISFSMSLFHFFIFFARIMKSKRCKTVWTQLTAQTNKHKHTFASCLGRSQSVEEKLQQKFVVELRRKTFLFIERGDQSQKSQVSCFTFFSVYCAQDFVYINYEERQQAITRMNVVACGNKKYNTKDGWTLNGIEQGSSEWT